MQKDSLYRPIVRLAAFCAAMIITVTSLRAVDEFSLDLDFLRQLGEIEFSDYAQMQLQQMVSKYPDKKDAIALETARLYYAIGKSGDADKIIASFPKTSEFFTDALILKGEVATMRKKFPEAEAAYKAYFAKVTKAPEKGKSAKEQFRRAVMIYSRVLKELGKGKEAAAILTKLEGAEGIGGDERQLEFLQLTARIDAEANKLDDRKPIDTKSLADVLSKLKRLQFVRDGVGASAYLQYARVHILLGREAANKVMASKKYENMNKINNFKEAIKTINMAASFLEELEATLPKSDRSNSPMAEAMFYKAQAIQRQAIATHFGGNKINGRKQILGAAKYYDTILEMYPDTHFKSQILAEHNSCAKFAEQMYNEKIEIAEGDGGDAIDLKIEQAETLFAKKDYNSCIPIYLEAVRSGRRSRKLPNVVMRLAIAYAQTDQLDFAESLISYVSEAMPKEPGSAESAYRYGGILYEMARKEANPLKQEELYNRAIKSWDIFVTLDPAHQKAPDVAFAVAELQYKEASDLAKKAELEKDPKKQEECLKQALQAFVDAIPKYRRLTEVFSAFDKGVRAYYKLGWIYHTINSNPKSIQASLKGRDGLPLSDLHFAQLGAEAFQAYYEEETNADMSDDRLEAKFRSAELTLFGDNPIDAEIIFKEIGELFAGKAAERGIKTNTKVAARIKEDSAAYLPWAFDLAGEKVRNPIRVLKEKQNDLRGIVKASKAVATQNSEELARLQKQKEALADEENNIRQIANESKLDFEEQAKTQMKGDIAKLDSIADQAEKQREMQEINNQIRTRAASLEKQKADSIKGDLISLEENAAGLQMAKDEAERALKAAKAELGTLGEDTKASIAKADSLEKEAKEKRAAIQKVEKDAVITEANKQRLEAEVDALNAKVDGAEGAVKAQAEADLAKAKKAVEEVVKNLENVYKVKSEVASEEKVKAVEALEANASRAIRESTELKRRLARAEYALKAAEIRVSLTDKRITLSRRRKVVNEKTAEVLAKPAAERTALLPDLAKDAKALTAMQAEISKLANDLFAIWDAEILRRKKEADAQIAAAEAEILKLEEEIKPIQADVDELKKKAIAAFDIFLKAFPKSTKAPDGMARLGTIYIELGENGKATEVLTKLAADFPESNANKTARFNLGRAQMDAGNPEEAAKTFKEMLTNKSVLDSLSLSNLSFIVDVGLKANVPVITVQTSRKIIELASAKGKAAEEVPSSVRDKAYVRSAEAQLMQKQYKSAIKDITDLLTLNPKTAYFYDAKFIASEARLKSNPVDLDGAVKELEEILQFSTDAAVTNKALCLLGDALASSNDPAKVQQASARYQLVALLGDISNAESLPWIEKAYVGYGARLKAEGKTEDLKKLVEKYKKDFPGGKNLSALNKLLK